MDAGGRFHNVGGQGVKRSGANHALYFYKGKDRSYGRSQGQVRGSGVRWGEVMGMLVWFGFAGVRPESMIYAEREGHEGEVSPENTGGFSPKYTSMFTECQLCVSSRNK